MCWLQTRKSSWGFLPWCLLYFRQTLKQSLHVWHFEEELWDSCIVSWIVLSLPLHHSCTLPFAFVKFSVTFNTLSKLVLCHQKIRHWGYVVSTYMSCVFVFVSYVPISSWSALQTRHWPDSPHHRMQFLTFNGNRENHTCFKVHCCFSGSLGHPFSYLALIHTEEQQALATMNTRLWEE